MKITHLKHGEQSDYKHGCIQITSSSCQKEAFELGRIFSDLTAINVEAVAYTEPGANMVAIRIPLVPEGEARQ